MGREIRRVPSTWEHPQQDDKCWQPMFEGSFKKVKKEWIDGLLEYERLGKAKENKSEFWEWEGPPPDPNYYVPYNSDDTDLCTWFQVYETVSEGTPVTPAFETPGELIQYLSTKGDFWDQRRGDGAWPLENAKSFVGEGYRPTAMVTPKGIVMARDMESDRGKS